MFDYLVVGAGFAGSVIAQQMASFGHKVMIVDRRDHIGGNAYDHHNEHGILVHKYGPHIFHTNSRDVFDYLSKFTKWRNYEHRVLASVDGKLVPIPINLDTVNSLHGKNLTEDEVENYLASIAEKVAAVRTSEDVVVSRVGRDLYEKMFRGYTRKQWGLDPSELDASVTANESRRPVLYRYVSGDAAARLHPHVREHAGPQEHHDRDRDGLPRRDSQREVQGDGVLGSGG
jgi:UDP-galactopyranose mutase